jgi:hypothetical protein
MTTFKHVYSKKNIYFSKAHSVQGRMVETSYYPVAADDLLVFKAG